MQVRESSTSILERDKTLKSFKKYERMYPWSYSWRKSVVNNTVYQSVGSSLGVEIIYEKEGTSEKECVEIKNWGFSVHFVLRFQENLIFTFTVMF